MRICIVSCYYNKNYGSMLQAYATQRIVEKLGFETVTLQCLSPINYMTQSKFRYYYHKLRNPDIVKKKLRQAKSKAFSKCDSKFIVNNLIRGRKFEEFYLSNINLSPLLKTRKELTSFVSDMDAVVVGSDMLWHPVNIEHDYYTLTFVPDTVKKIAYATSFGTKIIPKYQRRQTKDFLERFSALSVRELSGVEVIEKLGVHNPVQVVLDPTLLFSADEWINIQEKLPIVNEKYIFCYFLGVNKKHREIANNLKSKTGYKIVMLPHLDEYIMNDNGFGDYQFYDIGPSDFVNLIRNAEYVLTDSFHGTCFSLIHHKKFLTFNRFQEQNSQSTNTRIDSLLSLTNLMERHIFDLDIPDVFDVISRDIDYEQVDLNILKERKKSIEYLKNAIIN